MNFFVFFFFRVDARSDGFRFVVVYYVGVMNWEFMLNNLFCFVFVVWFDVFCFYVNIFVEYFFGFGEDFYYVRYFVFIRFRDDDDFVVCFYVYWDVYWKFMWCECLFFLFFFCYDFYVVLVCCGYWV